MERPPTIVLLCKNYAYREDFARRSDCQSDLLWLRLAALWIAIQKDERFLVTADKGFGDIRAYPPGTHFGVLLLRPDDDGIRPVLELLQRVLDSYRLEDLVGMITVATPRGIRLRRE